MSAWLLEITVGHSKPNTSIPIDSELDSLAAETGVRPGGRWSPSDCRARQSVAIIIPYRNRRNHLRVFLKHIHPFLQRQRVNYTVYIIEQVELYITHSLIPKETEG